MATSSRGKDGSAVSWPNRDPASTPPRYRPLDGDAAFGGRPVASAGIGFLDETLPLAIAHRGGAGDWPENTMPAFEAAVALGYRYVETDVHVTADGVLVAFHDPDLDRVSDRTGAIGELQWREVAAARVGGSARVPRFEDLLASFPELRVNVDPKSDDAVEPLADLVQQMGALNRVCVGSFSDDRIARLRERLGPALCTSLGPRATARLRAASFGLPVGEIGGDCVQVPPSARGRTIVDERFVAAAHRRGLQVHVWTIDEVDEMHRLLDLGVDGIMTDRPARLKAVLQARDQWST